jgi:hypothetical protein
VIFDKIEHPLSEILLWLESKRTYVTKIVPPMSSYTSPHIDSRKGLQKPESKADLADISSVRHLLRLIERTRGTTEEVIIEREKEIERQITLKEILLAKADLQEVENMRTGGHGQVCTAVISVYKTSVVMIRVITVSLSLVFNVLFLL